METIKLINDEQDGMCPNQTKPVISAVFFNVENTQINCKVKPDIITSIATLLKVLPMNINISL